MYSNILNDIFNPAFGFVNICSTQHGLERGIFCFICDNVMKYGKLCDIIFVQAVIQGNDEHIRGKKAREATNTS